MAVALTAFLLGILKVVYTIVVTAAVLDWILKEGRDHRERVIIGTAMILVLVVVPLLFEDTIKGL